ncbi:hypothetical protein BaOVIS_002500 [Babesia ovis]|uniref:Uncharacterized protein n=1 Tax=Babesia ovis TaxID=5869 RepID=A0A9W5T8C7_BABOV|nr:hypothetical protein BaOVIS_002500 [Babesia ovis]
MYPIAPFGGLSALRAAVSRAAPQLAQCRPTSCVRSFSSHTLTDRDSVTSATSGAVKLYAPYVVKEVQPPRGGSPLYWSARRKLFRFKTKLNLYARQVRWNICILRMSFAGVPKHSYDPKINQWTAIMDNEEWGGVGGRLWIDISSHIMFNIVLAFVLYTCYFRFIKNNKHNVLAKWARSPEDEEGGGDEE